MIIEITFAHLKEEPEKCDLFYKLVKIDEFLIRLTQYERGYSNPITIELTKESATQLMLALQKTLF